jgi:hypothetical protein
MPKSLASARGDRAAAGDQIGRDQPRHFMERNMDRDRHDPSEGPASIITASSGGTPLAGRRIRSVREGEADAGQTALGDRRGDERGGLPATVSCVAASSAARASRRPFGRLAGV